MDYLRLFADCLIDLQENNVSVFLSREKLISMNDDGDFCRGLWDDEDHKNLKLYCATGSDPSEWVKIFTHEYCHFKQFQEKKPLWKKAGMYNTEDDEATFHNKKIHATRMNNFLKAYQDLELDCEQRTVKLMKTYGLSDAGVAKYIQSANAYLYFYT